MENQEDNKDKRIGNMAKYSAIGFQMIATIGLFTFIGYKIDESRASKNHLFTAILGLLGVCLALYQVIRQVLKG